MKSVTALVLCGLLAPNLPAMALEGDAERGKRVFNQCRSCHRLAGSPGSSFGPELGSIFGRVVGKQPGFEYYSDFFQSASFVWTPTLMDTWLKDPMSMYPASTMMSRGVPDPQSRADLIQYLKTVSTDH